MEAGLVAVLMEKAVASLGPRLHTIIRRLSYSLVENASNACVI